jgi:hypothetical protein
MKIQMDKVYKDKYDNLWLGEHLLQAQTEDGIVIVAECYEETDISPDQLEGSTKTILINEKADGENLYVAKIDGKEAFQLYADTDELAFSDAVEYIQHSYDMYEIMTEIEIADLQAAVEMNNDAVCDSAFKHIIIRHTLVEKI